MSASIAVTNSSSLVFVAAVLAEGPVIFRWTPGTPALMAAEISLSFS